MVRWVRSWSTTWQWESEGGYSTDMGKKDPWAFWGGQANAMASQPLTDEQASSAAVAKAGGLTAALNAQEASLVDPTRREAFGGVAARGFYGGLADQSVSTALGNLHSDFEGKRQSALSAALDQVVSANQFSQQMQQQREQTSQASKDAKPWYMKL